MINAIHTGLQSTWLFATPAALAASANCAVNRVLTEFKRAIFIWLVDHYSVFFLILLDIHIVQNFEGEDRMDY